MTVVMKDSYTPPLPIPHISKHKKAPRLKVGNYDKRKQGFPDSQFDNLDRFTFEEESEMYLCLLKLRQHTHVSNKNEAESSSGAFL